MIAEFIRPLDVFKNGGISEPVSRKEGKSDEKSSKKPDSSRHVCAPTESDLPLKNHCCHGRDHAPEILLQKKKTAILPSGRSFL